MTIDLASVRTELDACPLTDRAREAVDGLIAEVERMRADADTESRDPVAAIREAKDYFLAEEMAIARRLRLEVDELRKQSDRASNRNREAFVRRIAEIRSEGANT
jgi:hypothetical protein